ncbi:MAG TPA: hypothetical protein VGY48_15445 [Vicinamibacterales bacterium]|jgi:hypothetical protein|nr:hypothetical protein [Vicinamibacterales bacterium]
MIEVGDKILVLVTGPHGTGLVAAVVEYVYRSSPDHFVAGEARGFHTADEGVTWIRGHDIDSPAARALLVAGTLGR